MKELAEKSEGQFTCLVENVKIYITFSVLIGKQVKRIGKNGENKNHILQIIIYC